jgi:carbamoyl-phosphate synthase/aspartate carbamoyltransferase
LRRWKEVEYEVVRDCRDNCITVCNMENFDPLGVHTGDSIVVAPSQTLSNSEYFRLRATAQKVVRHLGIVGECNIQYALDPHSERFTIIEVNARLSRSSALASKATGYPLAYVAAKLALNIDLVSIRNSVTKTTTACFEPSLDYCVVKVPRWDLGKFNQVSRQLGSSMLSVGEVMSIGRTFEEAIQKAIRMVNPNLEGITGRLGDVYEPGKAPKNMDKDLDEKLKKPADTRLFSVMDAFYHGYSVEQIHQLTRIDRWFLHKLDNIMTLRTQMHQYKHQLETIPRSVMMDLKVYGFSDRQIARSVMGSERNLQTAEMQVRRKRRDFKITPCVKQIDTLAAEYPAMTNYLYMTYSGEEDDVQFSQERDNIIVLGCGAYCIGSSVEFDWCAVSAVRAIQDAGMKAIVVNYNPETVSTDYDESDRLYFEELSLERVLDIYEKECPYGLVLSVGGQIPNNLAVPLGQQGVNVLGTSPEMIDTAEDRTKFSSLLDSIGVDQPMWSQLTTVPAALEFAQTAGYPVLVRPSYVLSGAAMAVAFSEDDLRDYLNTAINAESITEVPIIAVSKFIQNAKEIEFDGVAKDGFILNYAMSEHVENAGVHSGDATLVLPARKLYLQTIFEVKRIAAAIAHALKITGPFNIQLMARDNDVKVIECNLRASRTFPFISKTFDFNFISLATKAMLGLNVKPHPIALADLDYVGVKAPMFSFSRLRGCDPTTGVEMASTGEVACYGNDVHEAYLKALISTGFKMPTKLKKVLLSVGGQAFKLELVQSAEMLVSMGYQIFATKGTHEFLELNNIQSTFTQKISEEEATSKAAAVASKKRGKGKKATKDTIDEGVCFGAPSGVRLVLLLLLEGGGLFQHALRPSLAPVRPCSL